MAELGFNAYRFSLEWSRIEPEPGYFSRAELDHYRRMVGACREHGLEPVVTFNHFTTPRWFAGRGGWGNDQAPDRFARYAARVTDHLGDLLSWVATLNEPNLFTLLTQTGAMAVGVGERRPVADPGKAVAGIGGFDPAIYRMGFIGADVGKMALVHRKAVEAIKSGPGDAVVGWTLALVDLQLAEGGEERFAEMRQRALVDWIEVSREDDFIGVQTYSRERIGPAGVEPIPDGTPKMQTGWEVYPEALGNTVRLAAEHGRVPVLVTENGMATDDDQARIEYTSVALESLARCVIDGIDVRGYLHWTLLDNFEWISGYSKTFGLVAVDRESLVRTIKPSARWLGRLARSNGEDLRVHP